MRPRLLELTAFGPYADTVRIDFGDLGDDGLFLVHGPTGSGKTSILDGMTYALYGGVSGTRRPDRLRSDHADPRTATAVAFEFSLRGTDYRITRVPPHQRAKKYGSGMTLQKPKATLSEARDGGWEPVAEGVEEVGHRITDLLGLDREQFGQVVVLPQGAFAAALHADAKDRRRLLSSLFRTGRFEDYTTALIARAKRAEDAAATAAAQVERVRVQALRRWCVIDGDGDGDGDCDIAGLAARAALAAQAVQAAVDDATAAEEVASAALRAAQLSAERRRRLAAAQTTLVQLDAAADDVAEARAQLDAAERAQPLERLLADVETAAAEADGAAADRAAAVTALQQRPQATSVAVEAAKRDAVAAAGTNPVDGAALAAARDALHAAVVRLTMAVSQFEQAQSAALSAAVHTTAAAEHRAAAAEQEAHAQQLSARRETLVERLDAARVAAQRLPALRSDVARLEQVAAAAAQATDLREQCADLTLGAIDLKQRLNDALDLQRELLERRVEGMAAELAAALRDGEPCSVCGSPTHPDAATPLDDAVSAEALEQAKTLVADARCAVEDHDAVQARVRERLQAVVALAGPHADDPDAVAALHAQAATAAAAAAAAAAEVDALGAQMRDIDTQIGAARAQAAASLQAAAGADATAQECSQTALRLAGDVEDVAGVADDPGPALHAATLAASAADQLAEAARDELRLRQDAQAARERLDQMLAQCGFDGSAAAQRALLPEQARRTLRQRLEEADRQRAAAEDILAQEADAELEQEPPLDELQAQHAAAVRVLGDAQIRLGAVLSAAEDLQRLAEESSEAVAGHQSCAAEAQRLRRLADICSGSGNEHRMSLERYVLAAYFEEIAEAASQRLSTMTGGRYTLRHSDARVRGGAASGLSITVCDAYTGTEREAGTLSGGETFQASLCLALAVAEVVQRHAGGVHLDTLFIDEGFGALDADSLEQAMAELDALREGGRMVGVISHVPALRERINTGIVVTRTANGSDVRVETLVHP